MFIRILVTFLQIRPYVSYFSAHISFLLLVSAMTVRNGIFSLAAVRVTRVKNVRQARWL